MIKNNKKGVSAVALAVVIGACLFVLSLAYFRMVTKVDNSTKKFDEHTRLKYLADGVAQIALLKFQKYQNEFYDAWKRHNSGSNDEYNIFIDNSHTKEFNPDFFKNDLDQPASMFSNGSKASLTLESMTLTAQKAGEKWKEDVLTIVVKAEYKNILNNTDMEAVSNLSVIVRKTPIEL